MKKIVLSLITLAVLTLSGISCTSTWINKITIVNSADAGISLNFRGETIYVPSERTIEKRDIPPGTYAYSTTYTLPVGATSYSAQGDVSGELVMRGGTKVLIHYSSVLMNGAYTIFATMSTSDSKDEDITEP